MDLISVLLRQKELPPFNTSSWLLPHYPGDQSCSFNSVASYQKFYEFFEEASDEEKTKLVERKARFKQALEEEERGIQKVTLCPKEEKELLLVKEAGTRHSQESTTEVLSWLKGCYEPYISNLAQEVEVEDLYKWAGATMETLFSKFQTVETGERPVEKLLPFIGDFFACRHGGSWESKYSNEYLLQVLMYLEMPCFCVVDSSAIVKKVTEILRKLSMHVNPTLPAEFMHEVTPYYIGRCKDILLEVFSNMMYNLPVELQSTSSPSCSYVQPSVVEQEASKSEAEEPETMEEEVNNVGKVRKRFVRHRSFQEQSLSRQIMVPLKKKKKSSRKGKNTKLKKSPGVISEAAKSDRLFRRSACRRLFSRSHTVASINHSKYSSDDEKEDALPSVSTRGSQVLVKETPLKKQVEDYHKFKQQRLWSKSSEVPPSSKEVLIVEESPRRSFYSARKVTRLTPNFKTPPLNDGQSKQYSPAVVLNKDPSPAAIHSLMHDRFTSPSICSPLTMTTNVQCHATSNSHPSTPTVTQDITEKPDDILSSEELFQPCSTEKRSGIQGFRSARMLTYGETSAEKPSEPVSAESTVTPVKFRRSGYRTFQSPKKSLTPTNTRTQTPIRQSLAASYGTKSVPSTPTQSSESGKTPLKLRRRLVISDQ